MMTVAGGTRPWFVFAAVVVVLVSNEVLRKVLRNRNNCKRYTIRRGRSRYRVIAFGISFVFVSDPFYMRGALDE